MVTRLAGENLVNEICMKTSDGFWKLSPSGLYGFEDCKACFWIENNIGRHPFTLPLRLNDAMDEKLKNRYDSFRVKGEKPPELATISDVRLFDNLVLLNEWRNNRTALRYVNDRDGYVLEGKLDEVLVNKNDELIPADYKSSGDAPKFDKQKYYRLQLHGYALMLQEKGYPISSMAYLLHYFTKERTDPSLFMELAFYPDEVTLDIERFRKTMRAIVDFLEGPYPGAQEGCKRCVWIEKHKNIII